MSGRIGVVAVTYSPGDTLRRFLHSLTAAADWERAGGEPLIVLADNGSTDGTVEAAAGEGLATLLRTGSNLGFGGGANMGIQSLPADVRWVLVCNPDLEFRAGSVDELLAATRRWPRGAAFGPQLLTAEGVPYPSARELPGIANGAGHAVFGWWWPTNPWTKAYRRDHEALTERTAGWLSGACLLLRRSAFEEAGGFDDRFFMYFEDVDLGDRLAKTGWQNVYVPAAVVTHEGGHATSANSAMMTKAHHDSAYRYLAGRYPARWQAPIRFIVRVLLSARGILARRSATVARGAALPGQER